MLALFVCSLMQLGAGLRFNLPTLPPTSPTHYSPLPLPLSLPHNSKLQFNREHTKSGQILFDRVKQSADVVKRVKCNNWFMDAAGLEDLDSKDVSQWQRGGGDGVLGRSSWSKQRGWGDGGG